MTWKQALAFLALIAAFAVLAGLLTAAPMEGLAGKGERIAMSARPSCRTCHNSKLNPLIDVGERLSDQEIKDWIRYPSKMFKKAGRRGKMPPYRFPEDELEAVVAYLKTL